MPLYLDTPHKVEGLTAEAVAQAHARDLEVQNKYGAKYLRYWYDEGTGKVFCLCQAPSKEAAETLHRDAHGLFIDATQRTTIRLCLVRQICLRKVRLLLVLLAIHRI